MFLASVSPWLRGYISLHFLCSSATLCVLNWVTKQYEWWSAARSLNLCQSFSVSYFDKKFQDMAIEAIGSRLS